MAREYTARHRRISSRRVAAGALVVGAATGAVLPPGAEVVSDPVAVGVEAGRPVAVSLVLPRTPPVLPPTTLPVVPSSRGQ